MAIDPVCAMPVDETSAVKITHNGKDYFFCSAHCQEKFLKQEGRDMPAACCPRNTPPLYKNKLFLVFSLSAALLALSFFLPVLAPFRHTYLDYLKSIWWAVGLGLALGGLIDYYIPAEYISKVLSKSSSRTIFNAVFLGFLASACSHGILALSIQLHKKGASNPAVVSFLLASPWANFAVTLMLVSLFGLKGIFLIVCAIIVAVNTGFIFMFLEKRGLVEKNKNTLKTSKEFSVLADFRRRLKDYKFSPQALSGDFKGVAAGAVALSGMILWWILLGIFIASFASAFVPVNFFHKFMGPTFSGLLVTFVLATVIEVCSEGSSPLAFEIYKQSGALGNSFVFLMAGVATDYTEVGLLWINVGRRVAAWVVLATVPQILLIGYLANIIFK